MLLTLTRDEFLSIIEDLIDIKTYEPDEFRDETKSARFRSKQAAMNFSELVLEFKKTQPSQEEQHEIGIVFGPHIGMYELRNQVKEYWEVCYH